MASLPRTLLRPARRALARSTARVPGLTTARGLATVGNAPPMEPQKARPREMAVGEFEGATFTIEPLRRVGEDEKTMRARLVYQSRKRGILETDLLLSTFADEYLPTMPQAQMAEYDLFLDENDWDIYYWATQEEPTTTPNSQSQSQSQSQTTPESQSQSQSQPPEDTSAAAYGSSEETTEATQAAASTPSTGGSPLTGEHADAKTYASPSPSSSPAAPAPYAGEWAQTVGTFKPAYRPVPARWRHSAILKLVREHVRARAGAKGGMAFMPALRSS
ncbi:Flavinator of succinate dehydrogenase-domain-containing protein [Xylaria intraflava]|nr:Flavinator of succinate dehydrogenase-domain-containing protein [Xylaria intraflava]